MKELDKIPKENPFRVPENYFEAVTEKIVAATSEAGKNRTPFKKVIRLREIIAIAVSVAILTMLSITVLHMNKNMSRNIDSVDMTTEQIMEAIIYYVDITTLEQEIEDKWFKTGVTEMNNEEIIDFLINENIDPAEIYELL